MSLHQLAALKQDSIDVSGKFLRVVSSDGALELFIEGILEGRRITDKVILNSTDQYEFGGLMERVTLRDLSGAPNTVELATGWGRYFPGLAGTDVVVTNTVAVTGPLTDAQLRAAPVDVDLPGGVSINGGVNVESAPATPYRYRSAATTNTTSVTSAAGAVHSVNGTNTSAGTLYLKLYDLNAAPNLAVDVPFATFALLAGAPFFLNFGDRGIEIADGIAFAITGGIADADITATAVDDVVMTITHT